MCIAPGGYAFSAGYMGEILVWNIMEGKIVGMIEKNRIQSKLIGIVLILLAPIHDMKVSQDRNYLIISATNGITIWRISELIKLS